MTINTNTVSFSTLIIQICWCFVWHKTWSHDWNVICIVEWEQFVSPRTWDLNNLSRLSSRDGNEPSRGFTVSREITHVSLLKTPSSAFYYDSMLNRRWNIVSSRYMKSGHLSTKTAGSIQPNRPYHDVVKDSKCERAGGHFQQGEVLSRGLLHDCEKHEGSFTALVFSAAPWRIVGLSRQNISLLPITARQRTAGWRHAAPEKCPDDVSYKVEKYNSYFLHSWWCKIIFCRPSVFHNV